MHYYVSGQGQLEVVAWGADSSTDSHAHTFQAGDGRLSGDVWRVLYEQGGYFECVGWRYRLAGFEYVVFDARRIFFNKGQEMMVNNGLWLAGRESAVFLPHKSGPLKSSPLVCISHRDRSLAGILAACAAAQHRLCASKA